MTEQLQLHIEEVDEVRPLWERAMACAGRRLGGDVVESWLREAVPLSLRDGVLTLGTPNGTGASTTPPNGYSRRGFGCTTGRSGRCCDSAP